MATNSLIELASLAKEKDDKAPLFAARAHAFFPCARLANLGDWGGGDYQDLLAGVGLLVARGVADPERLGIMGWSYGGFMTSWAITRTNRFKAACIGAPVTDPISFNGTADIQ